MSDLDLRFARRGEELLRRHAEAYGEYVAALQRALRATEVLELDEVMREVDTAGHRLGTVSDDAVELAALRVAVSDPRKEGLLVRTLRNRLDEIDALVGAAAESVRDVIHHLRAAQGQVAARLTAPEPQAGYRIPGRLPALLCDRTA